MCLNYALVIFTVLHLITFVTSNDLMIGYATPYSRKIYSAIKIENPAFWRRTDDIMINAPYHDIITAVYVTDLRPDKEGQAYIEAGGIGSKTVTIALKSPSILRGYKFAIEVYGQSVHSGFYPHSGFYQHTGYMANNYVNGAPLSGLGGTQYPSYPPSYPSIYPNRY